MRRPVWTPLLLLAPLFLVGFEGGCDPAEPFVPEPGESGLSLCTELDESECVRHAECRPNYVESSCACPGTGSAGSDAAPGPSGRPAAPPPPCDCPPPSREFESCTPVDPCAGLDERSCSADPSCAPIFGVAPCPAIGCLDPNDPVCQCSTEEQFLGCQVREEPTECGPVCLIYCEFGNVLDEKGCPTCACNPGPTDCWGLDERTCAQSPQCEPRYGNGAVDGGPGPSLDGGAAPPDGDGGVSDPNPNGAAPCVCEPCREGEDCPPCHCGPIPPPPTDFLGCYPIENGGACSGRDEYSCASDGLCHANYVQVCTSVCPPGAECKFSENDCTTRYAGCSDQGTPDQCRGLDEYTCARVPECAPAYQFLPPPGCDVEFSCPDVSPIPVYAECLPLPPGYGRGCASLDEYSCNSDPSCEPVYEGRCDAGNGGTRPADGEGQGFAPPPPDCPAPYFAGCRDRQTGYGCQSDNDCPNGYCDLAPPPVCPPGVPCLSVPVMECHYPGCDDGSPLMCRMAQPICPAGQTAAILNGCYQCVDARSCAAPDPNHCSSDADCGNGFCDGVACVFPNCDDSSGAICDMVPPRCAVGETLAQINNCWSCVDARECAERQRPDECRSDRDCAPGTFCEHFATCAAIGCPPPPPSRCVAR